VQLSVGAFLKEHRRRLPRETLSLGPHPRVVARYGKSVTQEEVAEAIGVTRVWYAMLETGTALRSSPRLLSRLAEVLSLSDSDRKELFRLALPELSGLLDQ
jgi:transcriptional regulator with XRE-family HTH domain